MNLTIPLYINRRGEILKARGYGEKFTAASPIRVKRGVTYDVAVYFVEDDKITKYLLDAADAEVHVELKPLGKFDSAVAYTIASTTTKPATTDDPYLLTLKVVSTFTRWKAGTSIISHLVRRLENL